MSQQAVPQTAPPAAEVAKLYPDEINMKGVEEILGLSTMRVRTLVLNDQIPSSKKNTAGAWRFSRKAVEEYSKNRVRNARISDGKATYKVRLSPQEAEAFTKAFGPNVPLVKVVYANQKKKAAAKAAAAAGVPSPTAK